MGENRHETLYAWAKVTFAFITVLYFTVSGYQLKAFLSSGEFAELNNLQSVYSYTMVKACPWTLMSVSTYIADLNLLFLLSYKDLPARLPLLLLIYTSGYWFFLITGLFGLMYFNFSTTLSVLSFFSISITGAFLFFITGVLITINKFTVNPKGLEIFYHTNLV